MDHLIKVCEAHKLRLAEVRRLKGKDDPSHYWIEHEQTFVCQEWRDQQVREQYPSLAWPVSFGLVCGGRLRPRQQPGTYCFGACHDERASDNRFAPINSPAPTGGLQPSFSAEPEARRRRASARDSMAPSTRHQLSRQRLRRAVTSTPSRRHKRCASCSVACDCALDMASSTVTDPVMANDMFWSTICCSSENAKT